MEWTSPFLATANVIVDDDLHLIRRLPTGASASSDECETTNESSSSRRCWLPFKFLVDGRWTVDASQPTQVDAAGNVNNVVCVADVVAVADVVVSVADVAVVAARAVKDDAPSAVGAVGEVAAAAAVVAPKPSPSSSSSVTRFASFLKNHHHRPSRKNSLATIDGAGVASLPATTTAATKTSTHGQELRDKPTKKCTIL